MAQIQLLDFSPSLRFANFNINNVEIPIITLGFCSYIASVNYEKSVAENHVLIGNFTSIAHETRFMIGMNHNHHNVTTYPFDNQFYDQLISYTAGFEQPVWKNPLRQPRQIIIGSDVWIGCNATILGGVKIGNGAVIGANSVVAKDIPPYAVAVGNPARVVKYRFDADTIKKLLAVKWWSWEFEKVRANIPLLNDVEKFLAEHYSPELELTTYEEIWGGVQVERYLAEGRKVYAFVADFDAVRPLWMRIVRGFLLSSLKNAVMIFWAGSDSSQENLNRAKKFAKSIGFSDGKVIHFVPQKFSPYLLRNSTHFITTREPVTLECLDWLYGSNVKIISALDDEIFAGEPEVSWNEIYLNV